MAPLTWRNFTESQWRNFTESQWKTFEFDFPDPSGILAYNADGATGEHVRADVAVPEATVGILRSA